MFKLREIALLKSKKPQGRKTIPNIKLTSFLNRWKGEKPICENSRGRFAFARRRRAAGGLRAFTAAHTAPIAARRRGPRQNLKQDIPQGFSPGSAHQTLAEFFPFPRDVSRRDRTLRRHRSAALIARLGRGAAAGETS